VGRGSPAARSVDPGSAISAIRSGLISTQHMRIRNWIRNYFSDNPRDDFLDAVYPSRMPKGKVDSAYSTVRR
jgi:hypothetical protein